MKKNEAIEAVLDENIRQDIPLQDQIDTFPHDRRDEIRKMVENIFLDGLLKGIIQTKKTYNY